jgi:hypothetical protein
MSVNQVGRCALTTLAREGEVLKSLPALAHSRRAELVSPRIVASRHDFSDVPGARTFLFLSASANLSRERRTGMTGMSALLWLRRYRGGDSAAYPQVFCVGRCRSIYANRNRS